MADTDPKIVSEKFWLTLAAESISTSFDKRAASAKKLKELLTWAFGLLALTGFVGSIFGGVKNFPLVSLIFFGVGYALLTIAHVVAGEAEYPITQKFHPNDTEDIARAFSASVKHQSAFFKWATGITFLGFLCIAMAILFLFFKAREKSEVKKEDLYPLTVNASVIKVNDSTLKIPVTVMTLPVTDTVDISILYGKQKDTLLFKEAYKTDTTGHIYVSCMVKVKKTDSSYLWIRAGIKIPDKTDTLEKYKTIRLTRP
jgi:hypothetical protein